MHRPEIAELAAGLLPESRSALAAGVAELRRRDDSVRALLACRALPASGWRDAEIEDFMRSLAAMDANNAAGACGAGEREGRVYSGLVRARSWGLAHGVGRSGELTAAQPKAAGSSLLYRLTNALALSAVRACGIVRAEKALVVPCATGCVVVVVVGGGGGGAPPARARRWPTPQAARPPPTPLPAG